MADIGQAMRIVLDDGSDPLSRRAADDFLQSVCRLGCDEVLGPCVALLTSCDNEGVRLFAAHTIQASMRACVPKAAARQRSHVSVSVEFWDEAFDTLSSLSTQCGGKLGSQLASTAATCALKRPSTDLQYFAHLDFLKALPDEIRRCKMHPDLRELRQSQLRSMRPAVLLECDDAACAARWLGIENAEWCEACDKVCEVAAEVLLSGTDEARCEAAFELLQAADPDRVCQVIRRRRPSDSVDENLVLFLSDQSVPERLRELVAFGLAMARDVETLVEARRRRYHDLLNFPLAEAWASVAHPAQSTCVVFAESVATQFGPDEVTGEALCAAYAFGGRAVTSAIASSAPNDSALVAARCLAKRLQTDEEKDSLIRFVASGQDGLAACLAVSSYSRVVGPGPQLDLLTEAAARFSSTSRVGAIALMRCCERGPKTTASVVAAAESLWLSSRPQDGNELRLGQERAATIGLRALVALALHNSPRVLVELLDRSCSRASSLFEDAVDVAVVAAATRRHQHDLFRASSNEERVLERATLVAKNFMEVTPDEETYSGGVQIFAALLLPPDAWKDARSLRHFETNEGDLRVASVAYDAAAATLSVVPKQALPLLALVAGCGCDVEEAYAYLTRELGAAFVVERGATREALMFLKHVKDPGIFLHDLVNLGRQLDRPEAVQALQLCTPSTATIMVAAVVAKVFPSDVVTETARAIQGLGCQHLYAIFRPLEENLCLPGDIDLPQLVDLLSKSDEKHFKKLFKQVCGGKRRQKTVS